MEDLYEMTEENSQFKAGEAKTAAEWSKLYFPLKAERVKVSKYFRKVKSV